MIEAADLAEAEKRRAGTVRMLKEDLRPWIDQHSWPSFAVKDRAYPSPPYYSAVSCALLETAIERYVAVHGADQAIELITGLCHRLAPVTKRLS